MNLLYRLGLLACSEAVSSKGMTPEPAACSEGGIKSDTNTANMPALGPKLAGDGALMMARSSAQPGIAPYPPKKNHRRLIYDRCRSQGRLLNARNCTHLQQGATNADQGWKPG